VTKKIEFKEKPDKNKKPDDIDQWVEKREGNVFCSFSLPISLHTEFKMKSAAKRVSMRAMLIKLMKDFVEKE